MYAIFQAQGKQFRAVKDAVIQIPTLQAEPGDKVKFDQVLLAEREGAIHVGAPAVDGASVAAEVVGHGRGDKIIVYKMKRRKGYRRKQGHRQGYTEIRIVGITLPKGKPESGKVSKPAAVAAAKAPKAKKAADKPKTAPTDIDITDVARALAETNDIDLNDIEGSGKDGRILKSDIDKVIKAKETD
jgi:large subunit ribosomal protein L21